MKFVLSKFFWYHVYLLQLENYELERFWRLIFKKGWFPRTGEFRQTITWTLKLVLVCSIVFLEYFILVWATHTVWYWLVILLAAALTFFPLALSIAVMVVSPVDWAIKNFVVTQAKRKLKKFPALKIVGIAGSYGKTTVKECIAAALKNNKKILVTPENINTPIGISRLILNKLTPDVEVLVVEMGEYYEGDIQKICSITPPDIAIITGINEAHLERLKNLESTVSTIYEVARYAKPKATVIVNANDKLALLGIDSNTSGKKVIPYGYGETVTTLPTIQRKEFFGDGTGQRIQIKDASQSTEINLKLLGEYVLGSLQAAILVGYEFGLTIMAMQSGIESLLPVPHRLEPIRGAKDVLVIDDSYNGNPAGVREAIKVLSQFTTRRKIFLTPGLVEMGRNSPEIHEQIGRELAPVANKVLLVKNSATPSIASGLVAQGFTSDNIVWFSSALEAHRALPNMLKPHDVILFQNDWGDNYV